jgi:hypothetical protein
MMKNDMVNETTRHVADEILTSESLRKRIDQFLNSGKLTFKIKGKGEERAEEEINRIEANPLTELIQEYFDAVKQVKKSRKSPPEDKLKKLIPSITQIQKTVFPNYFQYHQFVDDRFIDTEKELDLRNLVHNPEKYAILGDGEFRATGLLDTRTRNIVLSKQYLDYLAFCRDIKPISESEFNKMLGEGKIREIEVKRTTIPNSWDIHPGSGRKSVSEIHRDWLPALNQKIIRSKDLLAQILVCYTIKRALNGDPEAARKLCDLYENTAEAIGVKFALKSKLNNEIEDIKQDARVLLKFLVSGFRADNILDQLIKNRDENTIRAIPKWIKTFFIYYLSEYIPDRATEILKRSKEIDKIIKFAEDLSSGRKSIAAVTKENKEIKESIEELQKLDIVEAVKWLNQRKEALGLEIITLFSLYTPIQSGTIWKGTPKRINRFNNYSFKPGAVKMGPERNLTTWLFGRKKEIDTLTKGHREDGSVAKAWQPYGKLYQLLRDKYKPVIQEKLKTKNFDYREDFDEDHEETLSYKERLKALRQKEFHPDISPEKVIKQLTKLGASQRDAEIFVRCKLFKEVTQYEIARERDLSKRQIVRICKKVAQLILSR